MPSDKALTMLPNRPARQDGGRFARLIVAGLFGLGAACGAMAQEKDPYFLADGFEEGAFSKTSGLFYKRNAEQAGGEVRFQSERVRAGKGALALSVRPSCRERGTACSERAEIWEKPEALAPYDQPLWYAFSLHMGDQIPTGENRQVMAQWKREIEPGAAGDFSPFLALRLLGGEIIVTVVSDKIAFAERNGERRLGCLPGEAPAERPDAFAQVRALVAIGGAATAPHDLADGCATNLRVLGRGQPLPKANSGWIDFVFMVRPDPSGAGAIEIIANGAWIASIAGAIGHAGPGLGSHQYFKFGPYREGMPANWTLYYDEFRRSSRCSDVAPETLCGQIRAAGGQN